MRPRPRATEQLADATYIDSNRDIHHGCYGGGVLFFVKNKTVTPVTAYFGSGRHAQRA
jgi:hypothetical protein